MGTKILAASMGMWRSKGDTLTLSNGLVETGFSRLTTNGVWVNALRGSNLAERQRTDTAIRRMHCRFLWRLSTPVKDSPFDIGYDLHWRAAVVTDVASLNGIIKSHLGEERVYRPEYRARWPAAASAGVDALLRKLRVSISSDTPSARGFLL